MTAQETKTGKVIGNVGVLDLRTATEEAVAEIKQIDNVGEVLCTPETAGLVLHLNIGNMGTILEIPADAKMISGQTVINRDFFKSQTEASTIVISGQAIIKPEVTADDIKGGLGDLIITGQILCPEHLAGVIQSKARDLQGQVLVYNPQAKLVMGNLTLDEHYLRALPDASELMVTGRLNASQVLPNDLLEQKIQKIQVGNRVVCREENAQVLMARLDDKAGSPKMTIIPAGFELVEQPLVLDAGLLGALPGRKLYCTRPVQIGEDVTAEVLDQALDALAAESLLVCPAALQPTIAQKCNLLQTQAIFYQGELWLVEGESTLLATRFDYLADKATLIVRGELTVAPEVEPRVLAERLDKVHLFGEIFCTPQQMAALQSRLGINQGELLDATAAEATGENEIGNVGILKL